MYFKAEDFFNVKANVKLSHYKPGQAYRGSGGRGSQNF